MTNPSPLPRICPEPVWSLRANGSVMDLAAPDPREIAFENVARRLSKTYRFCGSDNGPGWSVAMHCVRGAEAVERETGSQRLAALFLLHDAEEHLLGDVTNPVARLMAGAATRANSGTETQQRIYEATRSGWSIAKRLWRMACWEAAGLPLPDSSECEAIDRFDRRMCDAEMLTLFGAWMKWPLLEPDAPPLKLTGTIRHVGPMKAEEMFLQTFDRLIGREVRERAARAHSEHVKSQGPVSERDSAKLKDGTENPEVA